MATAPTTARIDQPRPPKPLRLWPGVLAVALQWLAWIVLPMLVPDFALYGFIGGIFGGGLAVLLWWLAFSRVPWPERLGALVLIVAAVFATRFLVHPSIANAGMGLLLYFISIPVLGLALVAWAATSQRLARGPRRLVLVTAVLLGCGVFMILRTDGITGEGISDWHWRWTPTAEQRLLALAVNEPSAPAPEAALGEMTIRWPGFRGVGRDGVVRGVRVVADWAQSPPVELWRRPVGPGWSSFAVRGEYFYTQEQRGEEELVACYHLTTGKPVWSHRDKARFWESNAGAGPRATPTLHEGRVYTLGATGIVNALDAASGAVAWSRNAAGDTEVKVPDWAFAGSPLVVDDLVIIATAGRLVAYDRATGQQRWLGPKGVGGYSSPHLATLGGVKQVLLQKSVGIVSVDPVTGKELWKYEWRGDGIVQPALTPEGDILLGSGSGLNSAVGVRRLAVAKGPEGWAVQERWTSRGLRPYFSDYVMHKGHAYGFDSGVLACLDLADGQRKWKGGRYGHGQVILLPDQDLLLVLSEKGELALVAASPDGHRELARRKAIEGKTWNHPVLVGDLLLVRNDQEMAAFQLTLAKP